MVLLSLTAAASPYTLSDVGRQRARAPVALVVVTPGLTEDAYSALDEALEDAGLDAQHLVFDLDGQDADRIVSDHLPAAVASLAERPVVLVGHGPGGTLAAMSVAAQTTAPAALVLLGAPLRSEPHPVFAWLAERPLPQDALDLATMTEATWGDGPVLPLLLGEPLPALGEVSAGWLATLQTWAAGELSVDLSAPPVPVWAAASGLDNIAPPEWVRPAVPEASFHRLGLLRFDSEDPDHIGLLTHPRALRLLSRWALLQAKAP